MFLKGNSTYDSEYYSKSSVNFNPILQENYAMILFLKLISYEIKKIFALAEKQMLNLTGISNTDLKLQYGTANITILSEYDTNFTDFVALLPEYTQELLDAGQIETAQMLLEFAVECKADSRRIYRQLASIYLENQMPDKIQMLVEASEKLPELTQKAIQKDLSSMN